MYYETNREKISERKKERYQKDSKVRERAKELARLNRAKKKAEMDKLRAEGKIPKSKPRKRNNGPIYIIVNGKKCVGLSINDLAENIGRPVSTVKNWIKSGVIPDTPFKTGRGKRLYSIGMILIVKMVWYNGTRCNDGRQFNPGRFKRKTINAPCLAAWNRDTFERVRVNRDFN